MSREDGGRREETYCRPNETQERVHQGAVDADTGGISRTRLHTEVRTNR